MDGLKSTETYAGKWNSAEMGVEVKPMCAMIPMKIVLTTMVTLPKYLFRVPV